MITTDAITHTELFKARVRNHLTLAELRNILRSLPGDAPLYANDEGHFPSLEIDASERFRSDIELSYSPDSSWVQVKNFLQWLEDIEGIKFVSDEGNETGCEVEDRSLLWIGKSEGAINGVRINNDGSYTISSAVVQD
jgi:hypothetical protein